MTGDSLLQSTEPLTLGQPDHPVGRDEERQQLLEALRPEGEQPVLDNVWAYGPAGTGKTTCVRHVCDQLDAETTVTAVYINCWQYNTRSSLLTELLIQLGYPAPRKGKPTDELLSRLREFLGKSRGIVVALDEFDQLNDHTEVIYDLQLVAEDINQELGLLLVSNQEPAEYHLDPRSESRLTVRTLEFQPYTAAELGAILEHRVEQAFRQGAVSDDALALVAEAVAEQGGDCRKALDLLLRAGQRVDQEGSQRVTEEVVETVRTDG